jgi:hypothetical protein
MCNYTQPTTSHRGFISIPPPLQGTDIIDSAPVHHREAPGH